MADFIRSNEIATIGGNVRFGKDGEWTEARTITTQFQGVEKTGDVSEFTDPKKEIVVWPDKFKTGEMVYPMEKAQIKK